MSDAATARQAQADTAQLRHASPKKRRRGRSVAIVLLSFLVVLIAGVVVLDNFVRSQVADFVEVKLQQAFSLDEDAPVTVEVAGFSVLGQLVTGSLDEVSADVDNVTFGELTGGVRLTLTDIPLDEQKPVGRLGAEFRMSESTVSTLVTAMSATTVSKVELVEPEILLGTEFSTPSFTLFGVTVPSVPIALTVGLEPNAVDGTLGFTPTSVELNGSKSTVDELRAEYGTSVDSVLQPQSICIAGWLPEALSVDDVRVKGKELVLRFSADNQILSSQALGTLGSCP